MMLLPRVRSERETAAEFYDHFAIRDKKKYSTKIIDNQRCFRSVYCEEQNYEKNTNSCYEHIRDGLFLILLNLSNL